MLVINKIGAGPSPRTSEDASPRGASGLWLRQHILSGGSAATSDRDLLALVLGGGGRYSSFAVADQILAVAGSLPGLAAMHPVALNRIDGLGPGLTARLLAALEVGSRATHDVPHDGVRVTRPEDVHPLLRKMFSGLDRERFLALYLDTRHKILATETVSVGTLNLSVVHPREVFKLAVVLSAAAVIVAHNHPSGCAQPSAEDLELTARLDKCGHLLGISLLDHLVAGADEIISIREVGWPCGP